MAQDIRLLTADEIDVRVAQTSNYDGVVKVNLLLYKDARVDMRILDEVYGPMNWKRTHQLIGDRLYCTIEVWDAEKMEWIAKQDVGTESNTEPEKGQASDAFKRAGFNVGIGRELYTAPKIQVTLNPKEYTDRGGRIQVWASFSVGVIDYDDNRNINRLVILDKAGNIRYELGAKQTRRAATKSKPAEQPVDSVASFDVNKAIQRSLTKAVQNPTRGQIMTKEQFKQRWDSGPDGDGITFDDIAECAKAWGLYSTPRTANIMLVKQAVLKAAGCDDETATAPMQSSSPSNAQYWAIVRAYGDGKRTKSGGDYRQTFIDTYNPTPEVLDKFDLDVQDYRAAKQDGGLQ